MSMDFPFAQNPSGAIPQIISYDLVIEEEYPGIDFVPTIPGATYAEIRVVNGCLWFVVNAGWNPNTLQWEQDTPCNPALPAYALVQCDDSGTLTWNIAQPSGAINTAVVWVSVWKLNNNGTMVVEPLTLTSESAVAEAITATWNAGSAAEMIGRQENITDTSSAAGSAIDQLNVNGTTVWEVRKDGTLVIGKVPSSAIVGGVVTNVEGESGIVNVSQAGGIATVSLAHGDYVDVGNAQTISAAKTFATVPVFFGTSTGSEGSIQNSSDSIVMAYGSKYVAAPFTFEAEAATAAVIEVKSDGTFNFYSDAGLTVNTTYDPTLRLSISPSGNFASGGVAPANSLAAEFEGTNGITTSYDAGTMKVDVSGAGLLASVTSTGGSIAVTFPSAQVANVEIANGAVGTSLAHISSFSSPGDLPVTASLGVLPGDSTANYYIEAIASGFDWNPGDGGVTTLAGSGGSWVNTSETRQTEYSRTLYIAGTATGGELVEAIFSGVFTILSPGTTAGVVTIKAIRTS